MSSIHEQLLVLRQKEKQITSQFIEKLQLMEDGRGYLRLGYSSLFDYLVRAFGYSESSAYQRQSCVRLSREMPEIKSKLDSGALSFSTLSLAYKSVKNKSLREKRQIISKIEHKSSREVKRLLNLPSPEIKIKQTIFQDKVHLRLELTLVQHKKLEKLKALKSHKHNLESLLESLIDAELKKFSNTAFKQSKSANPRQIPKRLRNHVLKLADYKCQFPGCDENHFLQIDHVVPVSRGGQAIPKNLQVLCGAHNRIKSDQNETVF